MEIVIAVKLENLLGVSGATTKGFVGVYRAVPKLQHGLKARVCPYAWLECVEHGSCLAAGISIMMCAGIYCKGKLVKQANNILLHTEAYWLSSVGCTRIIFAFFKGLLP